MAESLVRDGSPPQLPVIDRRHIDPGLGRGRGCPGISAFVSAGPVCLYAYVGNTDDGTVSVIDLVRVGNIATIAVGPAPSGLRANPKLNQIWGVSTQGSGGYAFVD